MTRAFPITQATWLVMERGDAVSIESPRETPFGAVIYVWAATALASWVLVGFVVAGVLWIVT